MALPTEGPHVFADPSAVSGDRATLDADESQHLTGALRRRVGDPVSVADGAGGLWQAEIAEAGPPVRLALLERHEPPAATPAVTVVHALPVGRKLDEVVRRLSELGVERLQPVVSDRCENRPTAAKAAKASRRWQAVAHAAAKQARRALPMTVEAVQPWPGALPQAPAGAVLWEDADRPLGEVIGQPLPQEVAVGVGPEGGLTAAEVHAAGVAPAALGTTILRTETAAVAACAVLLHRAGRLG